ncbi:nuclease-related domain-containing protein [Bacillus sp. FJAT-49736]|uniref:nuclease-related domain-containing protein n=1 Tax=Bacillus sp. FJAT-49736 TaxID=2833582 RepID=UPI001BCA24C9|nr:nuclease-related domain-containing protein [Bacillus sp. FJAT-49736]MBS4172870.1 NERD domain-containing protein [Bacillus sp. FJAT-49736]
MLFLDLLLILCIISLFIIVPFLRYQQNSYRKETNYSFLKVYLDKGLLGEYLTYTMLQKLPGEHKTIVNTYLPNSKGGTTEIDLVFIHETGIYVIESKNYSGWIFGKESDRNWCQMLPNRQKSYFYNPVKQNQTHMNALKRELPTIAEKNMFSLIVFSNRCQLKKISVDIENVRIIKRDQLTSLLKKLIIRSPKILNQDSIFYIYSKLKEYSNVSQEVKMKHVDQVRKYK